MFRELLLRKILCIFLMQVALGRRGCLAYYFLFLNLTGFGNLLGLYFEQAPFPPKGEYF